MAERYNLQQMLTELRADGGEPPKNKRLSQEEIKAMVRKRQEEAQKRTDNGAQ